MIPSEITVEDLATRRCDVMFDVRPEVERYDTVGFIPGSVCCSVEELYESMAIRRSGASGMVAVLVCLSGRRSAEAAQSLRDAGLPVSSLRGGVLAWRAAGLPTCGTGEVLRGDVPEVSSLDEFLSALKSCFVAEWAQNSAERGTEEFNPVDMVRRVFHDVEPTPAGMRRALDELAGVAWRQGHPLPVIAANVDRMHAAIGALAHQGVL